ncbi:MAG: hypothetical protein RL679_145 [Bacteroidota bacterium]
MHIMKKNILFSALFFILSSCLIAQDGISIQLDGTGPDISGSIYSVNLFGTSPELVGGVLDVHFVVTNTTGSDQQWKITRKRISVPASWNDQICWPPLCYNTTGAIYSTPNSGGNPAPTIINGTSETTNNEIAELKPRITPDQSSASYALYRYYITEITTGNYLDSVDLEVNFTMGVSNVKQEISVSIAPNPATDFISINLNGIETAAIKIVDVLGNTVFRDSYFSGVKKIDVSNFKNGIYFVMIESNGIKTMTRKVVIKH